MTKTLREEIQRIIDLLGADCTVEEFPKGINTDKLFNEVQYREFSQEFIARFDKIIPEHNLDASLICGTEKFFAVSLVEFAWKEKKRQKERNGELQRQESTEVKNRVNNAIVDLEI